MEPRGRAWRKPGLARRLRNPPAREDKQTMFA